MIGVKHERKNKVSCVCLLPPQTFSFILCVGCQRVSGVSGGGGYLQIIVCESSLRVGQRNILFRLIYFASLSVLMISTFFLFLLFS